MHEASFTTIFVSNAKWPNVKHLGVSSTFVRVKYEAMRHLRSTSWDLNFFWFLMWISDDVWLRAMPRNSIWHPEVLFVVDQWIVVYEAHSRRAKCSTRIWRASQSSVSSGVHVYITHIKSWTSLSRAGVQQQWTVLSCMNSVRQSIASRCFVLTLCNRGNQPKFLERRAGLPSQRTKLCLFKTSLQYLW